MGTEGRALSPASSPHPWPLFLLLLLLVIIFNSQPCGHWHLQSRVRWSVKGARLPGGFCQKAFSSELLERRAPQPEAKIFQQQPGGPRLQLLWRILTLP